MVLPWLMGRRAFQNKRISDVRMIKGVFYAETKTRMNRFIYKRENCQPYKN